MRQRRSKSISYEVLSCTPLLSVKEEIKSNLQILYKSKPVQQVHLVLVRIFNSGNMPIPTKDYEQPISLSFGEQSKILTAEIAEKEPGNLPASIARGETGIILEPTLLNRADSVTLKMLVNEYDDITIDGRVVGVKEIKQSSSRIRRLTYYAIAGFLIQLSGILLTLVFPRDFARAHIWVSLTAMALAMVGGSIIVASTLTILIRQQKS